MSDFITGVAELLEKAAKVGQIPKAFGEEFTQRVTDKSPTRTGLLKGSWVMDVKDSVVELRNTAVNEEGEAYASYVESGTVHMPGQFMIKATTTENSDIFQTAKKNVGL